MDALMLTNLKMWRYTPEDNIEKDRVYIIYGLKVTNGFGYNAGLSTPECCYRTAVEDVTDVHAIATSFWA